MANALNKVPVVDPDAPKVLGLSFKGLQAGHKEFKLQVLSEVEEAQSKDFDTDEPEFWPAKPGQEQGDPKMAAVFKVKVLDGPAFVGEERNVWATITTAPNSQFQALAKAQTDAGEDIGPGGILYYQNYGEAAPKNPKHNMRKLYRARYEAPSGNAFSKGPAAAPAASDSPWAGSNSDTPPF